MRPLGVVVVHPPVQRGLQFGHGGVLVVVFGEKLGPYRLMPPLHLPGGGR
jgi:hypothetical protein